MDLSIETRGNTTILRPREPHIDLTNARDLAAAIKTAVERGAVHVILDLTRVETLDSMGLGGIVSGWRSVAAKGDLRLCGLQGPVRQVFEVTRLDRVFQILADVESALGAC